MADNKDKNKCAHPSCTCTTTPGEKYCSPHCETTLESEIICGCGHKACQTTATAGAS